MAGIEIAAQISDIKHLIFTQEWDKALEKCEAVLNDPRAEEAARQETRALQMQINQKATAEKTIRDILESARVELAKPAPDYGTHRKRLQDAMALGNQHFIGRWNSQLRDVLDEIKRRTDIQVRFESEQRRFKEAAAAKNTELAIQIAQHMVEDAEINQQPTLAQAARDWLNQLGAQIQFDHLANSLYRALERDDYAGAVQLFEGLPVFAPRYNELSPLVEDARVKLQSIEYNLTEARQAWKNENPPQIPVTNSILSNLQRKYPKNWAWRPLYFEFYTYVTEHWNSRGDDYAARGQFEEAAQAYKSAKEPQLNLAKVFDDDSSFKQAIQITDARYEVCTALKEAQQDWATLNLDGAVARCKNVLSMLDAAPDFIKEAARVLRQRTAEYAQSLAQVKQAHSALLDAEKMSGDGDPADIVQQVEQVLRLGSAIPAPLISRAIEVQASAQKRLQQIGQQIEQARTLAEREPESAFGAYQQAYQVGHSLVLKQEIVKHCLTAAERVTNSDEKRVWYERALAVDPHNETVVALLKSVSTEFEANLVAVRSTVSALEDSPTVSAADLKSAVSQLQQLGSEVQAAPQALKRVEVEQQRLAGLDKALKAIEQAQITATALLQTGQWTEAIATLNQAGEALRPRRQTEQLLSVARHWAKSFEEAQAAFNTARSSYAEALKGYQATPTTEAFDEAADKAQHSQTAIQAAMALLKEGRPPREWENFKGEVDTLARRARTLREIWSARDDENRSLPEIVRGLGSEIDKADLVMADLITKLTKRAVTKYVTKADDYKKEGRDSEELMALETALELGGENPDLRQRINSIKTREERGKRLKDLRQDVSVLRGRQGRLRDAVRFQTDILRLSAEEAGPEWVHSAEVLINSVSVDLESALIRWATTDISESDAPELAQVQKKYNEALRQAEQIFDQFRETARRQGSQGQRLVEESELWLYLKKELRHFNAATSAAALGDLINATKNFLQLRAAAEQHPGDYDYRDELENTRRAMLEQLLQSASKRQAEAREALDKGLYDHAFKSLQDVETELFEPIEREFKNYRRDILNRLEEKNTPLFKVRVESRQLGQDVERLKSLAARLEAAEAEIRGYWRQEPEKVLQRLTDLKIDDPDQECKHIWKRLDRLAAEVRNHQSERAGEVGRAKIRKAEDDINNALTVADYDHIKTVLVDINADTLDVDYRGRRDKILATLSKQVRIPELLRQAQEQLELGNLDRAYAFYDEAIAIRPDLSRDSAFKQKYDRAAEYHRKLTEVSTLKAEAFDLLDSKPTEAAQKLTQALAKAQAQQLRNEVEDIQRLLSIAKAREALNWANESLRANDLQSAGRYAQEAQRFAKQGGDETLQWQAAQIADDMDLVVKVNIEAENLMRQRHWQKAIDVLQDTGRLPAHQLKHPVIVASLHKAEQNYANLAKLEGEVASARNSGDFAQARIAVDVALKHGAIAEDDALRLSQSVQAVEDKTRDWRQQLDRLAGRLPALEVVGVRQVDEAIRDARQLSDQATVTGLHDRASALAESLTKLRQQLEDVERVISNADASKLPPMDVLKLLKGAATTIALTYDGQARDIRYGGSARVQQIRQDAIRTQLNLLKTQGDEADDYSPSILQGLLDTCRQLESHLSRVDEQTRLEAIRKQFELAAERKKIERACEDWDGQIAELDRLEAAKEPNETLLERAQKIQQSIEQRKSEVRLMPEIWGRLDDVWQDVVKRRNRYEEKIEKVIKQAREAMDRNSDQVRASEIQCTDLLKTVTGPQRAKLEAVLEDLRAARKTLEAAERRLAEAKQQVRSRAYAEAVKTLDALPTWPTALRVERETLGKVVGEVANFEALLKRPIEIATEDALNDRLQDYRQTLQRLQDFQQKWPTEVLRETEGYVREIRPELVTLIEHAQQALCQTTSQLAQAALNALDVNRARSLVHTARTANWVTDNQAEFVAGIEHEIAVVQATLELEEKLMKPALDKVNAADEALTGLLKQPRIVSPARRLRAVNTQKLAEAYQLVVQGRPEDVQLAGDLLDEDPRLVDLPAFRIINRIVRDAKKEMAHDSLLIKQANDLIFNVRQAELSQVLDWLPALKERAEKQEKIRIKLDEIRSCITNEEKLARSNLDFARLRALNPLARDLGITGQDSKPLDDEQKEQLGEALDRARQALKVYAPEEAQTHLDTARRLSEGVASTEIIQLDEERKQQILACAASDRCITKAESAFSTGEYDLAAREYLEAVGQTPLRKRVAAFAESKHLELLRQFNDAAAKQFYPAALKIAECSLAFKFKPDEWQALRNALSQQRDNEAAVLITTVTAALKDPEDPKSDFPTFSDRLKSAIHWEAPRHGELQNALTQVDSYLERSREARLDVRNGWPELDQGNFERALDNFRAAQTRLPIQHPEITKWLGFATAAAEASKQLTSVKPDLDSSHGGYYRVVYPGWDEVKDSLTRAFSALETVKRTMLLGDEGEAQQQRHRARARGWLDVSRSIDKFFADAQSKYNLDDMSGGAKHYQQALAALDDLKQALRTAAAATSQPAPSSGLDADRPFFTQNSRSTTPAMDEDQPFAPTNAASARPSPEVERVSSTPFGFSETVNEQTANTTTDTGSSLTDDWDKQSTATTEHTPYTDSGISQDTWTKGWEESASTEPPTWSTGYSEPSASTTAASESTSAETPTWSTGYSEPSASTAARESAQPTAAPTPADNSQEWMSNSTPDDTTF